MLVALMHVGSCYYRMIDHNRVNDYMVQATNHPIVRGFVQRRTGHKDGFTTRGTGDPQPCWLMGDSTGSFDLPRIGPR